MDYDLIVVKTLERVYKNYYYIIRGNKTVRKKVTNKTKKILGAFAVAGMLAMSVNLYRQHRRNIQPDHQWERNMMNWNRHIQMMRS